MPTSSPKQLEHLRTQFCYACFSKQRVMPDGFNWVAPHHIQEKGMGSGNGGDDWWNLIPLCRDDHNLAPYSIHRNTKAFLNRYPKTRSYLKMLGWEEIDMGYKIKLVHPAYVNRQPKEKAVWSIKLKDVWPFLKPAPREVK